MFCGNSLDGMIRLQPKVGSVYKGRGGGSSRKLKHLRKSKNECWHLLKISTHFLSYIMFSFFRCYLSVSTIISFLYYF